MLSNLFVGVGHGGSFRNAANSPSPTIPYLDFSASKAPDVSPGPLSAGKLAFRPAVEGSFGYAQKVTVFGAAVKEEKVAVALRK